MSTLRPRALALAVLIAAATAGCGAPLILENPTTKQRVNCSAEAERLIAQSVLPSDSTGKDVPRYDPISPAAKRFDYERQCKGNLEHEGFVCVSGC